MSLEIIFALSSPLRFGGAALLGVVFGLVFLSSLPVHGSAIARTWGYLAAGLVFGLFDTARRFFEGLPNWSASIATSLAFACFVLGSFLGMRLRERRRS